MGHVDQRWWKSSIYINMNIKHLLILIDGYRVKWEKTCLNKGEPSSKAKYDILRDSV